MIYFVLLFFLNYGMIMLTIDFNIFRYFFNQILSQTLRFYFAKFTYPTKQ